MNYKWAPKYPESRDAKIELKKEELSTYVSDRKPGVMISEYPLDNPACFIINRELIYFRINWKLWTSVSCSNSDEVQLLAKSPACQIYYTVGNTTNTLSAPVYHIKQLPSELFAQAKKDELNIEKNAKREAYIEKIKEIIREKQLNIHVYETLFLGGIIIPLSLASDNYALLIEFMSSGDIGSERNIVKKLKIAYEDLKKEDLGSTKLNIGIICDELTLMYLKAFADKEIMADVILISIEEKELTETLISLFK